MMMHPWIYACKGLCRQICLFGVTWMGTYLTCFVLCRVFEIGHDWLWCWYVFALWFTARNDDRHGISFKKYVSQEKYCALDLWLNLWFQRKGGFLKWGIPLNHPLIDDLSIFFHCKPSMFRYPHGNGNPHETEWMELMTVMEHPQLVQGSCSRTARGQQQGSGLEWSMQGRPMGCPDNIQHPRHGPKHVQNPY